MKIQKSLKLLALAFIAGGVAVTSFAAENIPFTTKSDCEAKGGTYITIVKKVPINSSDATRRVLLLETSTSNDCVIGLPKSQPQTTTNTASGPLSGVDVLCKTGDTVKKIDKLICKRAGGTVVYPCFSYVTDNKNLGFVTNDSECAALRNAELAPVAKTTEVNKTVVPANKAATIPCKFQRNGRDVFKRLSQETCTSGGGTVISEAEAAAINAGQTTPAAPVLTLQQRKQQALQQCASDFTNCKTNREGQCTQKNNRCKINANNMK